MTHKVTTDHKRASPVRQRATEHLRHPIDDVERGRVLGLTRELLDLSQEELAQRAGVERSWLALTELGRIRITGPRVRANVRQNLQRIETVLESRRSEKKAELSMPAQLEDLDQTESPEGASPYEALLALQNEMIEVQKQLIEKLRAFNEKSSAEEDDGFRMLEQRLLDLRARHRTSFDR